MATRRLRIFWLATGIAAVGQLALLAVADADCVQESYDPGLAPWSIDPNAVRGSLLLPDPGDPSAWEIPAGKWNRPAAICCDPCEAYPVRVTYAGGTIDANAVSIMVDDAAHTWTCAAELPPGDHILYFEAVNTPRYGAPAVRQVTIALRATMPPNKPPVLN